MSFILDPEATSKSHPDRFISMSITRNPNANIPAENKRVNTVRPVLVTDDIQGARSSALPPFQRTEFHDPSDIEGARPKPLHYERRNKPDFTTTNLDIEESQPRINKFRSNRRIDPLAPDYALPATHDYIPPPAPFKRDLHNINDIEGTKSNAFSKYSTRDHYNIQDIAGTSSRPRTKDATNAHIPQLYVRDINDDPGTGPVFKTQRITDPLRPAHIIHGRVVTDDDPQMYVKSPPRWAGRRPFYSLATDDIEGARTAFQQQVAVGGIPIDKRRTFLGTNFISDINGTQAGSKPRGLTTVRMTDPLERDYVLLDGRRWGADELTIGKSWYNAAAALATAEAADQAATMAMGKTGIANAIGPTQGYARKILDPRDAELARLRGEVDTLRKEREVLALKDQLATLRANSKPVGAAVESTSTNNNNKVSRPPSSHLPPISNNQQSSRTNSRMPTPVTKEPVHNSSSSSSSSSSSADVLVVDHAEARDPADSVVRNQHAAKGVNASHTNTLNDPLAALRSTAATANARNILGVIPATRPPQNLQSTGSLRQSGRYDSNLDQYPSAPRGNNPFSASNRSNGHMNATNNGIRDNHAIRVANKEHRNEINEVRSLPN